ncbi:MAG: hypothetical protein M3082_14195 [Candidatus Dormibacteraeota bacterium]|nr:hypothetical protein [Candidatus Dormibacteraeota bacterium]
MRLHFERERDRATAEAEARGEDLWTDRFEEPVRVKLIYALRHAAGDVSTRAAVCDTAQLRLASGLGKFRLTDEPGLTPDQDFINCIRIGPDWMMPSVIEAMVYGLDQVGGTAFFPMSGIAGSTAGFKDDVKRILLEHRVGWDLVGEEMVKRKSQELHAGVIEPVVRLLAGRKDLAAVESAYQDALREVTKGTPDDAITDAGRALQEMLLACDCKGNTIGELAADARKKNLLAPHDTPLAAGLQTIIDWVSADRSQKGDAHRAWNPSREDAWLTIHVVGAVIVRLEAATKR